MSFGQVLSILKARWLAALLVFVLTVGTTVAVSLLLPKQYTANASVVADFKPDPVALISTGLASSGFMATQVDVIMSERVALRVIRNLRLADNPQVRELWLQDTEGQGSIETWMVTFFQKQLEVKPSRESSVITVSYKAPDAGFAAAMANAFVQAYLQTTLELRVEPAKQYSTFFDTRAKEARDALEKAQSKLSAFQKENGIIASDERLDIENARLNELSSQAVMLQALASESGSRQAQARGESADKMQEVLNNPLISGLKADLSRAEAKLQELQARLGDYAPAGGGSQGQHRRAAQQGRRRSQACHQRCWRQQQHHASTCRRRSGVAGGAAHQGVAPEGGARRGSVLLRDVESCTARFRTCHAALEPEFARKSEHAEQHSSADGGDAAIAPVIATRCAQHRAVGGARPVLLAIGIALLLEMMDRRIRGVDDVAETLGLAVIGILPKPTSRALLGGNKPSLAQQRMVGRLAAPAKGA